MLQNVQQGLVWLYANPEIVWVFLAGMIAKTAIVWALVERRKARRLLAERDQVVKENSPQFKHHQSRMRNAGGYLKNALIDEFAPSYKPTPIEDSFGEHIPLQKGMRLTRHKLDDLYLISVSTPNRHNIATIEIRVGNLVPEIRVSCDNERGKNCMLDEDELPEILEDIKKHIRATRDQLRAA